MANPSLGVGIEVLVSETLVASVADTAAWAPCLAEIQMAVGPRVVEVGNPDFVEAVVDLEHPVPPAGTEMNPEQAARRKKSVAAALPPIANPERSSAQDGVGVEHPHPEETEVGMGVGHPSQAVVAEGTGVEHLTPTVVGSSGP